MGLDPDPGVDVIYTELDSGQQEADPYESRP